MGAVALANLCVQHVQQLPTSNADIDRVRKAAVLEGVLLFGSSMVSYSTMVKIQNRVIDRLKECCKCVLSSLQVGTRSWRFHVCFAIVWSAQLRFSVLEFRG